MLRTVTAMWVYIILLCLIPFIQGTGSSYDEIEVRLKNSLNNDTNHTERSSSSYLSSANTLGGLPSESTATHIIENYTHVGDLRGSSSERKFYQPQKEWTVFMLFFNAALPLVVTALCYVYVIVSLGVTHKSILSPTCVN